MLDKTFTAKVLKSSAKGGWTYAIWPESTEFFKTKGAVKVKGTIDGQAFQTSFMAMGGGVHMLPVKADLLSKIGKSVGDEITVHLTSRLT